MFNPRPWEGMPFFPDDVLVGLGVGVGGTLGVGVGDTLGIGLIVADGLGLGLGAP